MAQALSFTSIRRRAAYNTQAETVSAAGAISTSKLITKLSVDGTKAYTLAAGTWIGQEKVLICSVATNTPVGSVAGTFLGGTSLSAFGVVGECARLIWDGAQWLPLALDGVTVS